jgi:hypothetical protein
MGCSLDADANPKIWLDSLLRTRVVGKLFTGNMTVGRQRANRSNSWIGQKKLTIGSERLAKSDGYDIA